MSSHTFEYKKTYKKKKKNHAGYYENIQFNV